MQGSRTEVREISCQTPMRNGQDKIDMIWNAKVSVGIHDLSGEAPVATKDGIVRMRVIGAPRTPNEKTEAGIIMVLGESSRLTRSTMILPSNVFELLV